MDIATKITRLRVALGLNKREFAEKIHISPAYMTEIEKGNKTPSNSLLDLIMSKFKVSEEWWEIGEGEIFIQAKESANIEQTLTLAGFDPVQIAYVKWFAGLSEKERSDIYRDKMYGLAGNPIGLKG